MASLSDVFTESERTNWLKAWLAIDIAKSGLELFVDNAPKILHSNINNAVLSSGSVACSCCHIANLLKCPSRGICKKREAYGLCISMHDTALKQPRQCPASVCNKVFVEIAKQHRYPDPSWKNTVANDWASSPWQIAKVYFPPDGYTENRSAQDTDFNGIVSFIMNCKHFNNMFSFPICPGKTYQPCLLTKTRAIGRVVRHSSTCKITDTDLQDIFTTLTGLLTDRKCLANELAAQEAVRKLAKLQTDVLKLKTDEIVELLEAAQNVLKKVANITETAVDEIRIYMENCRKDMDTFKQELSEHTGKCIQEIDENRRKFTESNYEQSCKDEFTLRKTFALTAGILTNRKDKSRTGSSNSFVHKTVQEFLAAYHIACNTYIIDDVRSRYLKLNNTSYLEISQVLTFLCGINISAANKLSALMNQYDVIHCDEYEYRNDDDTCYIGNGPCTFQRIIESGIREAVANQQEGIQLTLSHFNIDQSNIRELHGIWPTDTCNAHVLRVYQPRNYFLRSPARGESKSHFEFNLSSCHTLRQLYLSGSGILLRDTASSVSSEFPVCIVLNNARPVQSADTPPALTSIEHICLESVTCSSTCLRSLFSTLLTLNHKVRCALKYVITACVEESDIGTNAVIETGLENQFKMQSLENDCPGLWEALHGLNIKSLCLEFVYLNHQELFWQFLSSLTLEKLSVKMDLDIPSLCKGLDGRNLNDLSLSWSYEFQDWTANNLELLSECLSSLIQLETLSMSVRGDSPSLWEALRGLNIKSLSLSLEYRRGGLTESLSKFLSSLTQLKTLSISVFEDKKTQSVGDSPWSVYQESESEAGNVGRFYKGLWRVFVEKA
ncbi:uncharacterized protein LOC127843081 isoform X3 [Dreissena polymorpha]|uniref:uncharacterized protein LOC127843081 isoform X3 n=1 Tax=Dreissena polymorpha TaxID=45954 RepID=UPI0022652A89|nr:uncharacterized protein LOC127843081 isoform X3 [Dreissena polymorpha]